MWGQIMTEANTLSNFNYGFSTYKSDILVHLSQWQYWWWFWFSLFWALYFFIIIRIINKNIFHFNPVINTSIRGHGKWGDFLVALIPLSWCGNILVNSNFILRMIEWQNESSLFTLRVQGKQWYWAYKFDAAAAQSILAAPKNIGNNKWVVFTPHESYCADSYYQALQLGTQLEFKELYLKRLKDNKITKTTIESLNNNYIYIQPSINVPNINTNLNNINNLSNINTKVYFSLNKISNVATIDFNYFNNLLIKNNKNYNNTNLDNTVKFSSNVLDSTKVKAFTFIKGTLTKHNLNILLNSEGEVNKNIFLTTKFFLQNGALEPKTKNAELIWGFKQKKYKRIQKFKFQSKVFYDSVTHEPLTTNINNSALTLKSSLLTPLNLKADYNQIFDYHRSIKYNRHRGEIVPVNLARRLLRTKRTLVLPAHVNITVITNSYDVVHSWFIPGLGLKLDCVPGRSTHHTFYIDNIGFYYGQCAEICGRYHHHMPIKLCALPFEQFLVWWQRRGIKRLHRVGIIFDTKKIDKNNIKFKYNW